MTQKTYTQAEFGDLIEKSIGKKITDFSLFYPSDPRCQYRLWLSWHTEDGNWETCYAEDVDDVACKLQDPTIISVEWHRRPSEYVTIVRRDDGNCA